MNARFVRFDRVSFRYDSMPAALLRDVSFGLPQGWTGVAGANGTGKSTLLKLATGLLRPDSGWVQLPSDALYCAQRTDEAPEELDAFLAATDGAAAELRGQLGIAPDWAERWLSLSHGERKRAQLGAVLWRQPAVLAVDEPTNHIDAEARAMLVQALQGYRGIGLIVSHDRGLLDLLCSRCLFVDPPAVVLRPGNYSVGRREALREEEHARSVREKAKREMLRLQTETRRRVAKARASERKYSKRNLDPGDRDGKGRIDLARLTGADGTAARLARQMQVRLDRAREFEGSIQVRKEYELGIWVGSERCRRDTLFRIGCGVLPLGERRVLSFPDLTMLPGDRVALTGANGNGKSTLLRHVLHALDLPDERLTYLPQEIDRESSQRILTGVRSQPREILGRIMTAVSRLGSRPARLLQSDEPSPGEVRKLMLGLGIALQPHLIVMDEPTNHLDLPSIECLEEALADCPCGLLLVSHDERFLEALTRIRWHIVPEPGPNTGRLHLQVS